MSLNPAAGSAATNAQYQATIIFPREGDYPAEFATAYDDYAVGGVVNGAANSGGDKAILEAALRAAPTNPAALGAAFAQYWATVALIPVRPNVSVVNDAVARADAFTGAIAASVRATESVPYFGEFIANLEAAAKTVVWTITPRGRKPPFTSGIT
jgi:hypothetical protein